MRAMLKIALLHQANKPPVINGIVKPMKPGGYKDSGADIAYTLSKLQNWQVITPANPPNPKEDYDWAFPDTESGINQAINAGANVLWANTILYSGHPITGIANKAAIVGQNPEKVQLYDDKDYTNRLLGEKGLSIPSSFLISNNKESSNEEDKIIAFDNLTEKVVSNLVGDFPIIVKPIRGRGSQGVKKINSYNELHLYTKDMFSSGDYGNQVLVEEFLSGDEFTISVFPPGTYELNGKLETKSDYWAAPAVIRVNHQDGVAPYNGVVAVTQNSFLWKEGMGQNPKKEVINDMLRECEIAAKIVDAKAPIRVDCRINNRGKGILFDLNMKPNMTGPGRPNRDDQDNLVSIAVSGIGRRFSNLVDNIARNSWTF